MTIYTLRQLIQHWEEDIAIQLGNQLNHHTYANLPGSHHQAGLYLQHRDVNIRIHINEEPPCTPSRISPSSTRLISTLGAIYLSAKAHIVAIQVYPEQGFVGIRRVKWRPYILYFFPRRKVRKGKGDAF